MGTMIKVARGGEEGGGGLQKTKTKNKTKENKTKKERSRIRLPALLCYFSLVENYSTVCIKWVFCVSVSFFHVLFMLSLEKAPAHY